MNSIEGKTTIENIEKQTEAKVEASEKLTAEAQQVSSTLESIDTTGLDPEDISAYNETKLAERADHSKSQGEIHSEIDGLHAEARQVSSELEKTKAQVERNESLYRSAAAVSETGRNAAEKGAEQAEHSSEQYGEIIYENNRNIDASLERVRQLHSEMSSLFN